MTYREQFERTPVPERGPWLIKHGFKVYASKEEVRVVHAATGIKARLPL